MPSNDVLKAFWDSRASLGIYAGTRDRIAKELEMRAIAQYVQNGMSVLDVGCGDGETLLGLLRRFPNMDMCCGIDASSAMIAAARAKQNGPESIGIRSRVVFREGDVTQPWPRDLYDYDLVYTERCLINLTDWSVQLQAIQTMLSAVKSGGKLLLCECSADGLKAINHMRSSIGLPEYAAPGHNRYLINAEMQEARRRGDLPPFFVKDISSTYYFLSRIVNAKVAQEEGREPDYDSPINRLALSLPPETVWGMGQVRLWVFSNEA